MVASGAADRKSRDTSGGRGLSSEIEIEIITDRLSDNYLMSPNDLHRGAGHWVGLTPGARCLLAALLSYRSGWRLRREDVDRIMRPLGRRAVDTVLRELQTAGFIDRRRSNAVGGRFVWQWRVRLRPDGPSQERQDISAGGTIRTSPADGERADGRDLREDRVCPGGTIRTSTTDGERAPNRRTTTTEELREELPPYPPDDPSAPSDPPSATGEPSPATIEHRQDVEDICRHLADRVEANGSLRPVITRGWRDSARLLLDRDGRTVEQVLRAIDWCQDDDFWRTVVLSMPKLRKRYDQLRLAAQRGATPTRVATADQRAMEGLRLADEFRAAEDRHAAVEANPFAGMIVDGVLAIGGGE